MVTRRTVVLGAITVALAAGCKPDFDDRPSRVLSPRLLAIRAEPAEAPPAGSVTFRALVVGGATAEALSWALCTTRKPLTELGAIDPACLARSAPGLVQLGTGPSATAEIPKDACRLFGPDTPEAKPGEPSGRPVDADSTGGYYLPVRALLAHDEAATASVRVSCGVSGATAEQLVAFEQRARPNRNPEIAEVTVGGASLTGSLRAARGASVVLRVSWSDCPTVPVCGDGVCGVDEDVKACAADCDDRKGCAGAELYGVFDTSRQENAVRREAMRVSWFSDRGEFVADRTGRTESDAATFSENTWTAPGDAAPATIWLVLRDDRGGVAWREISVDVS
jgi:hypothetical protein